jgi:hypothetical protein
MLTSGEMKSVTVTDLKKFDASSSYYPIDHPGLRDEQTWFSK